MMWRYSPTIEIDAVRVLQDMMPLERMETEIVAAGLGKTAMQLVCETAASPHSRTAWYCDDRIGIVGSREVENELGAGIVWALFTDKIMEHKFEFMRESRDHVWRLAEGLDFMFNWVWIGNLPAIRWLNHMGFRVGHPVVSVQGEDFLHLEWRRADHVHEPR